jgi:hypothetical protein
MFRREARTKKKKWKHHRTEHEPWLKLFVAAWSSERVKLILGDLKLLESEFAKRFVIMFSLMLLLFLIESFRTPRGCNVAKDFFDLLLSNLTNPCQREACFETSASDEGSFEEQLSESSLLK